MSNSDFHKNVVYVGNSFAIYFGWVFSMMLVSTILLLKNPISDIADSYFIQKVGYENIESKQKS